jgi:stringent starvation protein B
MCKQRHQFKIVLNISNNATTSLVINNEAISFKARFDGKSQDIYVPTDAVLTIYTGENGECFTPSMTREIIR